MNTTIPKQRITFKEKKKKDFQWGKDTIKAYIDRSDWNHKRKQEMYELYDFYNGKMNDSYYDYVSDPYKSANGTKRKFPAKLRSYNIIKPVIDLLLGEKDARPFNYQVVANNSDVTNRFEDFRTQQYIAYLEQSFINNLNERGMDTGLPSKEIPDPEQFAKQVKTSYRDKRAILGQQALDYIIDRVELKDKLQTLFLDWLVTGEVYSYKGAMHDEVEYEPVSAVDMIYEASPGTVYMEDGDMAGRRKLMSVNQVLDVFGDVLTDDEITRLESPSDKHRDSFHIPFLFQNGNSRTDYETGSDRWVEVIHINWKSMARVGFIDKIENGIEKTIQVSDWYKPEPGEKVDWRWVSEAWEGYQIDGDIYKHIRPINPQRNELTNKSECKLQYNGKLYSNRNSDNISIVQMGIPYQVLYNIFHFRLELSIAKNKDKIALIEMNMIPKKHGWDEEKFMYFADAMGFAFIDSSAVGQDQQRLNFNQFQVLDMSLGQYISAQFELLSAIKAEWEELLGITRQRRGQILASDGASNTNMAVGQSNVITSEIFRKFAGFEQRDLQGLLDVSKVAWKDGMHASYLTSEYREAILNIGPDDIQDADLNVFVKNSTQEDEKLKALKTFAFQFAQNGSQPSTVADILDSNNFAEIKEKVKEVEQAEKSYQEQVSKMEGDQAQQLEALKQQAEEAKHGRELEKQGQKIASDEKMHSEKMDLEWAKLGQEEAKASDSSEQDKIAVQREAIASKERIENKKIDAVKQQKQN